MNWQDFIKYLLEQDLKLSPKEVEALTGIPQPVIDRWKTKLLKRGKAQRNVVRRLEQGLNILIDDSDPEDIKYEKLSESKTPRAYEIEKDPKKFTVSYPILGQIPAGLAEVKETNDWPEYSDLYYDPRKHFWLQIDDEYGFSMNPFLKSGDLILCAVPPFKLKDGDLVAVRWDKTKGALKLYKEKGVGNDKLIILTSYNASESPIVLKQNEIEQIYKVVNIKKK